MDGIAVTGEIVTAGTALAGFILIYIGTLGTSFGSYNAAEQKTIRARYLKRAWLAFVGFALALLATALGLIGKWFGSGCTANAAAVVLLAAFAWAVLVTVQTIREME